MLDPDQIARLAAELCLRTDRLVVRRLAPQDIDAEVEQHQHPDIMRYILPIPSRAKARADAEVFCDEWLGEEREWCVLAVVLPPESQYLGAVVFRFANIEDETVELGYRLHPDFHGMGYASEACRALLGFLFDTCGVRKVIARCAEPNRASFRLMERLGMRREAHLRRATRHGEEWIDELEYGLFPDERTNS